MMGRESEYLYAMRMLMPDLEDWQGANTPIGGNTSSNHPTDFIHVLSNTIEPCFFNSAHGFSSAESISTITVIGRFKPSHFSHGPLFPT